MEYIMIEKEKIDGKEVYHRCSTKREENEGSKQYRYYICDNCKEHPSNSTYLGISTQDYIINRQRENKHIFCTDKEYQENKVKKETKNKNINELAEELGMILFNFSNSCENPEHILRIKIKDGLIKNASIIYEDIEEVSLINKENKTLKFQLQELHQANINLHNENEKLKKELKDKTKYVYKNVETKTVGSMSKEITTILSYDEYLQTQQLKIKELEDLNSKLFNKNQELERKNKYISNEEIVRLKDIIKQYEHKDKNRTELHSLSINCDSLENKIRLLNEQLEFKETINQDLAKKYQLLQEEIDAYDINMLELVEKHSKLEKDYNELSKNMVKGLKVTLQHRVKPYLGSGVVNVIIETKEEFK